MQDMDTVSDSGEENEEQQLSLEQQQQLSLEQKVDALIQSLGGFFHITYDVPRKQQQNTNIYVGSYYSLQQQNTNSHRGAKSNKKNASVRRQEPTKKNASVRREQPTKELESIGELE